MSFLVLLLLDEFTYFSLKEMASILFRPKITYCILFIGTNDCLLSHRSEGSIYININDPHKCT